MFLVPSPTALRSAPVWDERLSDFAKMMQGWVWQTDAQHRFIYKSVNVEAVTGLPAAWHYGKSWEEICDEPRCALSFRRYQEQTSRQQPFGPIEFQRRTATGSSWLRVIGKPKHSPDGTLIGYCGVAFDVSAEIAQQMSQATAMIQLAEAFELMHVALDELTTGISVFDEDLQLAFANASYYELLGLSPQRFPVGSSLEAIMRHLDDCGEFFGSRTGASVEEKLARIRSRVPHTYERTRRNGHRLEINNVPLANGGHLRTYCDSTNRVEMAWKLGKAQRDLIDRERDLQQARQIIDILRRSAKPANN